MTEKLIDLGGGFWSIRGDFRLMGLVNLGTQAALVRRPSGKFVMLDSYTLSPGILAEVHALTDAGAAIEAIVNLHPFHTLHCEGAHRQFPDAKLYGLARHKAQWPDLPWQDATADSPECQAMFADTLELSVPHGVRMVTSSDAVHAGSVLAYHGASKTLHVDDTLSCTDLPFLASLLPMSGRLDFHPTLSLALERRSGAVDEFKAWAHEIADRWSDCQQVCTAHSKIVTMSPKPFDQQIKAALNRTSPALKLHSIITP